MFCTNCGKSIPDGAKFCPVCGAAAPAAAGGSSSANNTSFNNSQYSPPQNQQYGYNGGYPPYIPPRPVDAPNAGFLVLGLFFPLVGFILWLVWRDETPLRAKSAGKGALIGVCVWVGLVLLIFISVALFAGFLFNAAGAYGYA